MTLPLAKDIGGGQTLRLFFAPFFKRRPHFFRTFPEIYRLPLFAAERTALFAATALFALRPARYPRAMRSLTISPASSRPAAEGTKEILPIVRSPSVRETGRGSSSE